MRGRDAARRAVAEPLAGFTCKDVHLRVENNQTIFTCGYAAGQTIRVPVAHHDGSYTADPDTLDRLEGEGRVAFRYCGASGALSDADNFNGSARAIAGVSTRPAPCWD